MSGSDLYGAIDLGGTNVRAIVADLDGNIAGEDSRLTETQRGTEGVFACMVASLEAAAAVAGVRVADLGGVGIASPGTVDVTRGVVSEASQLPDWNDVPLVEIMSRRLGVAVCLENDASAAALGEHRFGAGRGTRHMLYLTVSTGVGGGIIIQGELYRGASGAAGELGHMIMDPDGPPCGCGARGCLEALASGTAIAGRGEELAAQGASKLLTQMRQREGPVTAEMMKRAADAGDGDSRRVFREAGHYLGVALASYVNIFSPDLILIGGGVARAAEYFMEEAEQTMRTLAKGEPLKHVRLGLGELGDRAGSLGMIALMRGDEGR